jgi:hypothetical protein
MCVGCAAAYAAIAASTVTYSMTDLYGKTWIPVHGLK